MVAGNHTFLGINEIEAQDRINEHRCGVPPHGTGREVLLHAPVTGTSGVRVVNVGEARCELRLRHQGQIKAVTAELLAALAATATHYVGRLQFKDITPGSVSIVNAGAPLTIVDDGAGVLHDTGVPTAVRGTIDYATGLIDFTYGAAPTEPVQIAYSHSDYTDFASPQQASSAAAGAFPFALQLGFGRVNPGSVSITEGTPLTFVDDGKGNIIETTGGIAVVVGTIDYATGLVTLTSASGALAGTVTATYTFNPFAAHLVRGAAAKMLDTYDSSLPEFTAQPWAVGIGGETRVGLVGEATEANPNGASLVTQWAHYGEEPYRVEGSYSGFPPGGAFAVAGNSNA